VASIHGAGGITKFGPPLPLLGPQDFGAHEVVGGGAQEVVGGGAQEDAHELLLLLSFFAQTNGSGRSPNPQHCFKCWMRASLVPWPPLPPPQPLPLMLTAGQLNWKLWKKNLF